MTTQTASIPELAICRREPFALEMASLAALPSVRHAAPIPPLLLMALSAIEQTIPLFSREDVIDRIDAAVAVSSLPHSDHHSVPIPQNSSVLIG